MRRGVKVAIGVAIALCALLAVLAINALIVDSRTATAEVTVPGGRILDLPEGEIQVLERGPTAPSGAGPGGPIVLLHCFTCAIDWWDAMLPHLARRNRVIAVDLRGHGGSEKPGSGYSMPEQAAFVAAALRDLGVHQATVVGHSLGGSVAVALAEGHPGLVGRVAIVDMPADIGRGDLGLLARLTFAPLIGQALWTVKPDFSVRQGLEVAFAPGYEVPDAFVEDVKRLTFTAYDDSGSDEDGWVEERHLDRRMRDVGKPLLAIMGAEERIVDDPRAALEEYSATVPGARTELIAGAGHSPNVEKPALTAALVLAFAKGRQTP